MIADTSSTSPEASSSGGYTAPVVTSGISHFTPFDMARLQSMLRGCCFHGPGLAHRPAAAASAFVKLDSPSTSSPRRNRMVQASVVCSTTRKSYPARRTSAASMCAPMVARPCTMWIWLIAANGPIPSS